MKVAVVTGSTRGIGRGIAEALEGEGWTVVRSATSESCEGSEHYCRCDISDTADRQALLDYTVSSFGRVDLLVNNAGVAPKVRMDILETSEESFDHLMRVNLRSTFFMCQLFARQMIAQGGEGCRIVNISSVSSYATSVERGEYCVSKAGISMTTRLFAHRLAEYGIGVFEVRPGIILTDMTAPVREKYQKLIDEGLTPIKRFGTPKDVADCVLACCSGLLDFTTGQVLNADGGFHLRRF